MIKVGAATEIEMKEKKARVEDALHATRAAVEEGVVPGGGVALIRALKALEKLEGANEDQTVGIRILARAIEEPLRQIVENAGEDAAVVLNAVKAGKGAYGYNAATGEYGDMLEEGILDPAKVTRLGAAERGVGRGPAAHDGSHDRGSAEGRRPCARRRAARAAWAAWAAWTCKERKRSLLSDAQRLAREDKDPRRETAGGFFVSGGTPAPRTQ